jgi:hypothetical protein
MKVRLTRTPYLEGTPGPMSKHSPQVLSSMCDAGAASEKRDSGAGPAAAAFNTNAFLSNSGAWTIVGYYCASDFPVSGMGA